MKLIRVKKTVLKCCIRMLSSDKTTKVTETLEKEIKKLESNQQSPSIVTESDEDCTKFEARVIKQISIEKEQDAKLQSRLSKAHKVLFSKSDTTSSACNKFGAIRLDPITLKRDSPPDWFKFNFDNNQIVAQNSTKKQLVKIETPFGDNTAPVVAGGAQTGGIEGVSAGQVGRPVRGEPGKVLFAFVPEEWWRAFFRTTGITGFGTFLFTFATFLVSKEYYVLDHYFYHGLSTLIMWTCGIKYLGPRVAKWLDKQVDDYDRAWNEVREQEKQMLEESILDELRLQYEMDGQLMVTDAKRENVQLQLEEEYRKRQMYAYKEVKRRLDYHVTAELVRQRIRHKNLVEYVTREVVKSITPELQDKLIHYSIDSIMQELESQMKDNK